GLVNTVIDNAETFELTPNSVFFQSTSIGFDAATWVIWMSLRSGATMTLASSGDYAQELTQHQDVTHIMMTPSMLQLVSPEHKNSISHVVVGGEFCSAELINQWLVHDIKFFNAYGPTEVSICSSIWRAKELSQTSIGRAISNIQFFILNDQQALSPKGSIGELYLGGDGLARGYLNQPTLTAERFIDNPYFDENDPHSSKRLYRTGDLVRYLPDGELAFMGRTDDQVKIRGFRIELGEIETQLAQQAGVESAVVTVNGTADSQQLMGYIHSSAVLDDGAQTSLIDQVKTALAAQLPEYMVPSVLMVVHEWPLTPNGKVDKRALP
ncbi:amino acid adenylation domain-containing protein, partial [Pseudoalteromonas sp. MMG012]|nr:amino acid adenylation domain-containing protein [Pseudoalteromonas sp. MMG012]